MSEHLVRLEGAAKGFRFIAKSETVDIRQGDRFVTFKSQDFEKLLGHRIDFNDGVPLNLSAEDTHRLGKISGVLNAIDAHPFLSEEAKKRLRDQIKLSTPNDDLDVILEAGIQNEGIKAEVQAKLLGLRPRERRKVLKQLRKDHVRQQREEVRRLDRELANLTKDKVRLQTMLDAAIEAGEWAKKPLVMQTPPATMFHHLRQSVIDGSAIFCASLNRGRGPRQTFTEVNAQEFEDMWSDASVFLIEHDWAAAFAKATDYSDGEIKLPDDVCVFEFRISGRHVIVIASDADGRIYLQPIVQTKLGWIFPQYVYYYAGDRWEPEQHGTDDTIDSLVQIVGQQIKAVAIALDAEVAASEIVRAPHKLNHARERRGKLPVNSYHVISLSRRSRAPRLDRDPDAEPAYHVRLHFRRGHWRHYENHKTWIRWMLVGDPDLGFVDKHYKL